MVDFFLLFLSLGVMFNTYRIMQLEQEKASNKAVNEYLKKLYEQIEKL